MGKERSEQYRLVIPRKLRISLLKENHDSVMESYLGIKESMQD